MNEKEYCSYCGNVTAIRKNKIGLFSPIEFLTFTVLAVIFLVLKAASLHLI